MGGFKEETVMQGRLDSCSQNLSDIIAQLTELDLADGRDEVDDTQENAVDLSQKYASGRNSAASLGSMQVDCPLSFFHQQLP
jgi:hypothetical protein